MPDSDKPAVHVHAERSGQRGFVGLAVDPASGNVVVRTEPIEGEYAKFYAARKARTLAQQKGYRVKKFKV